METSVEKKVKKNSKFYEAIEKLSEEIDEYYEKINLKDDIPETKVLVYNRMAYPIIYEIPKFFYLGGIKAYMVSKKKCALLETNNGVRYYNLVASDEDIAIGKSPITPIECPIYSGRVYPNKLDIFERKLF